MRILTAIGALVFGYLTIIPAGLLLALWDSACAGSGCESALAIRLLLTVAYLACTAVLLGTAALMAGHMLRSSHASQERLVFALAASAITIGLTGFTLLAISAPKGAAFGAVVSAVVYTAIRYGNRARPTPDPVRNGHREEAPSLNGHGLS